ncbi:peptidase M6 [Kineococcus esterisolvens]|uniref:peptidase M6 n=1 Tax=Kineococcus sp. SYSU DK015 TaxID=3383136 RepID=UPI003D7F0988
MGLDPTRGGRIAIAALSATALAVPAAAVASPTTAPQQAPASDLRLLDGEYRDGEPLPVVAPDAAGASGAGARATLAAPADGDGGDEGEARVGDQRDWPALVDGGVTPDGEVVESAVTVQGYTLRGLGDSIEVWVADDLSFPEGDCRNTTGGGELTVVTDEQVAGFVEEFDETILPVESEVFSVAPPRDGSAAVLGELVEQPDGGEYPEGYWTGRGERTVALIDNVRDQNFYDPTNENGRTYIAGFFYSLFNDLVDRNVMTIDGFDWLHRTGENPPDDSQEPDYLACADYLQRPGLGEPAGRTYEATFAHEYQHLLEHYADPDEVSWVNEGLSMWSEDLLGFSDPAPAPNTEEADNYIATFLGFNEQQSYGGPEQSITLWGDQGDPEILADYGSAYAFMVYLHGRFGGDEFMTALHNEPEGGLAGLDAVLRERGHDVRSQDVLHDFLASMAVDAALDGGAKVKRGDAEALQAEGLTARVNWDSEQSHGSPGAPVNGADYVRLRDPAGYVDGGLVTFKGSSTYPTTPVEWEQDGERLYSGSGDNLDRGIVREFTIPVQDPTIGVDLQVDTEEGWDFAVVQVWDAAAGGWVSLSGEATTTDAAPGADPRITAELPGLTGEVSGTQTFDASAYAGQTVDVAIRYLTDGGVAEPGVWVGGVRIGGQSVADATDLSTWRSLSEAHPTEVAGWTVQLVGTSGKKVSVVELPVVRTPWGFTTLTTVKHALGFTPEVAAVLVTADDPTETVTDHAPYELCVNGVLQPGGGTA